MSIFSCDTIVALGNSTKSGNVIFAKNSDRPVNEAQPLVICEAEDHQEGKMLQCTYIEIPQVRHTYRVIGSRPHWIWGFEHGMNEHKVIIGNEAVWSKEKVEEGNAFLGMDLLRLGLERGKTAYEAMHIIITLLEKYGQGGNCTYGKETYYHNSFIIADPGEAWILETVNRRWIAKRVKDAEGISNLYSITDKWEEASSDIKEHAYKMGWYDRTIPFNFAKAYSAMSDMVQIAYPRWKRLNQLLQREKGNITIDTMKAIQRDHYEGELIEPRFSPADGIQTTICVHSPGVDGTKTAAASVAELTKDTMPVWYHCFSNPCASVFIPCYLEGELPEKLSTGGEKYSTDSLWWKFESLNYKIEEDYPIFIRKIRPVWDELEQRAAKEAGSEKSREELTEAMRAVWNETEDKADELYQLLEEIKSPTTQPQRSEYLHKARTDAGII